MDDRWRHAFFVEVKLAFAALDSTRVHEHTRWMNDWIERSEPGGEHMGIGHRAGKEIAEHLRRFAGLVDRQYADPKSTGHPPNNRLVRSAFPADIRRGV